MWTLYTRLPPVPDQVEIFAKMVIMTKLPPVPDQVEFHSVPDFTLFPYYVTFLVLNTLQNQIAENIYILLKLCIVPVLTCAVFVFSVVA